MRVVSSNNSKSGVLSMPIFSDCCSASPNSITSVFAAGHCRSTLLDKYENPFFRSVSVGRMYIAVSIRGVHWRAANSAKRPFMFCASAAEGSPSG